MLYAGRADNTGIPPATSSVNASRAASTGSRVTSGTPNPDRSATNPNRSATASGLIEVDRLVGGGRSEELPGEVHVALLAADMAEGQPDRETAVEAGV